MLLLSHRLRRLGAMAIAFAAVIQPASASAQSAPATYWGGPAPHDGTQRRSPALMITGYSLAGTGTAAIIAGATMIASDTRAQTVCDIGSCSGSSGDPLSTLGAITLAAGGGVTAIGVGLAVWGTMRVHGPEEPARASATPTVLAGPGAIQARWRF